MHSIEQKVEEIWAAKPEENHAANHDEFQASDIGNSQTTVDPNANEDSKSTADDKFDKDGPDQKLTEKRFAALFERHAEKMAARIE